MEAARKRRLPFATDALPRRVYRLGFHGNEGWWKLLFGLFHNRGCEKGESCVVETARWALIVYGALMILGGILGYVLPEKPSKISLISGAAIGVLSIAASLIARSEPLPGLAMGLVVAEGSALMLLPRWREKRKFMPMGMLVVASGAMALVIAVALATME